MSFIQSYRTILQAAGSELIIKKSRFIAQLQIVHNSTAADTFLEQIKKQHPKANHHCFAYQIKAKTWQQRFSDAGEPSGTAGAPILNVLEQKQLQNVICVVTRYFGGIKLGAGGLIRAYGQAAALGVQACGIAQGIPQVAYHLSVSYAQFERIKYYLDQKQIDLIDPAYSTDVQATVWFDVQKAEQHCHDLKNLTNGQISLQAGKTAFRQVPIISPQPTP